MDVPTSKRAMRWEALSRRDEIPPAERASRGFLLCERMCEKALSLLRPNSRIAVFYPMGSELDLRPFMLEMIARGMKIVLPAMVRGERPGAAGTRLGLMVFLQVDSVSIRNGDAEFLMHPSKALSSDHFDLARFERVAAQDLDMVIVPLLAFDGNGNRLGYGGGNYDYFLGSIRDDCLVVGVAYREQQVDSIPLEPHDFPLPHIEVI